MNCACSLPMVSRMRDLIVPSAQGKVLEIGLGTGLNLAHYRPEQIDSLTGLEPAAELHPLARRQWQRHPLPLEIVTGRAERLPFDDAIFDTIVLTYTLCSVQDPPAALQEMRRVLKPDGQLLFCEHGLSPDAAIARWQNRLQPLWGPLAGGCHLNRDIAPLMKTHGWDLDASQTGYLPGPKPWTYHCWGSARKRR